VGVRIDHAGHQGGALTVDHGIRLDRSDGRVIMQNGGDGFAFNDHRARDWHSACPVENCDIADQLPHGGLSRKLLLKELMRRS
jgi:hypothetical protein